MREKRAVAWRVKKLYKIARPSDQRDWRLKAAPGGTTLPQRPPAWPEKNAVWGGEPARAGSKTDFLTGVLELQVLYQQAMAALRQIQANES